MSLTSFVARIVIFGWRQVCYIYTLLRYGSGCNHPSFLLKFETPVQKKCYDDIESISFVQTDLAKQRQLIIIPFRDKWALTAECIKSVFEQELAGIKTLIALVDNGSTEPETFDGIRTTFNSPLPPNFEARVLRYDIPFNYSKLNNLALNDCRDFDPSHIVFLNNDVVMTMNNTLVSMISFLNSTKNAASVGCTLLYPNNRIQHLFIAVGCKIVGAHPFRGAIVEANDPWFNRPRPVGAATAALLVVKRSLFDKANGFDETLPSCYQDVDLALKFQKLGASNWVLPWVSAIHYETQTRSPIHAWTEVAHMHNKWGEDLTMNAFLSEKISRWSERVSRSLGEGSYPWKWLAKN